MEKIFSEWRNVNCKRTKSKEEVEENTNRNKKKNQTYKKKNYQATVN